MKHLLPLLLLLGGLFSFCSSAPSVSPSTFSPIVSSPQNGALLKVFNGDSCQLNHLYQSRFKSQVDAVAGDIRKVLEHVMSAQQSGSTYEQLAYFVDKFGPRFTGTPNLESAIDFMLTWLKKEGHENVHAENVSVPVWVSSLTNLSCLPILNLSLLLLLDPRNRMGDDGEASRQEALHSRPWLQCWYGRPDD